MEELARALSKAGFKTLLKRYSLFTYLNPRKASKPEDYKGSIFVRLFKFPHIENFVQFMLLPIATLVPPCRGSLVLVAQKYR